MNDVAIPAGRPRRSRYLVPLAIVCVVGITVAAVQHTDQPGPEALLNQALALADDNPAACEQLLGRAIRAHGGRYADAEIALCRMLTRRKAWEEAELQFSAIDMTACRSDHLMEFGREAVRSRLRPKAIAALEVVSQRDTAHAIAALDLLIATYREWGERQKLIAAATRLTRLQPESARNWTLLIECLTAFGSESECVTAMREALRHGLPAQIRVSIRYSLVQQLVNLGQVATAWPELEDLRREEGESVRVRGLEVYLLRLEGRLEPALVLVTEILAEAPDLAFAHFTRGIIYVDMGRFSDAIMDLEKTIVKQPFNAPAHFKLSEAYRGLNRHDLSANHRRIASEIVEKQKRITVLAEKREANPLDPLVYRELEQLHRELGETKAAETWHRWATRVAKTEESVELPR